MIDTARASHGIKLRLLALLFAVCAAFALSAVVSRARDWPSHPVKIIVPYGPGGITDVIARVVADRLAQTFGQPFVLDNRGGAGGAIGTEFAARAPNDGYLIYIAGGSPLTVVPQIQKVSYDPTKALSPVSMISKNPMAFTVHPDLPIRSLAEFIDYVKARPGQISYSVGGIGSSSQLAPALLAAREGLDMLAVPYQGMPPAVSALLAGTVQMFFGNITDVIEQLRGGRFRLLAVSGEKRSAAFPDIPTVAETLPGFTMIGWHGVFVPAGTPRTVVDRLSGAITALASDPEFIKILGNLGIDSVGSTPGELALAIQSDIALYKPALAAAGLLRHDIAR
jgi:tripartite-type tricarboxylate transporter receptor subunit TctC